ncbi:zinc finger SWIM domain-containing protein 7 isoform X2 [Epinephelus moara]|uniref:zinc finger SWIM domain-containing protein 7 isoform X2 n=1 Tax=Epinephelus moara TaxID=300413 RepID=UPI00214EBD2A|nr:zinc finger SWIM domain-containing protein 7 isoform X2 [Epinephelus moara]
MRSFLPAVAEQLLRDIQKTYQETSQIPDDLLIALKFVFGPSALQALDLVDQHSVTCVSSPSGRKAFQCNVLLGDVWSWRSCGCYLTPFTPPKHRCRLCNPPLTATVLPDGSGPPAGK